MIKKRFITFNEEMKLNLKIQQHIQIIDKNIEMSMIKNNISYICKRYQIVLDRYKNIEQIEQELRTYFSIHMDYQI